MNSRYREEEKDISTRTSEKIKDFFIGKYTRIRYKIWMFRKESKESKLDIQDISRICSEHVVPVTLPLALISEIQGSGGTLLSQLFDGHPELHVHPHELMIGSTETSKWPHIDLSDGPERWFEILYEDIVNEYNREGYKKEKEDEQTFPFVFISSLQREIFLRYIDSIHSMKMRNIFNAYMTSYFGAWLNNQNYYGPKKFITSYAPRLGMIKENVESFLEAYQDGRLIFVVRDPNSWFPSAKERWPGRYSNVGQALSEWNEGARAMLQNKEQYGDCVCLIQFEDLVSNTEPVMRYLAEFLTIEFDDILLVPSFNKFPIKEDTALKTEGDGIVSSFSAEERTLTEQELNTIERMTSETYALVLKEVVRFE